MLEILVKYLVIPSCPLIIKNEALKYLIGFLSFWPEWSNRDQIYSSTWSKIKQKTERYKTMLFWQVAQDNGFWEQEKYKSPTNVRLLGLARLQNISSIQKKKRIVFVHTSYTQKMKFYNNAIYSHFTNMKYLGEKSSMDVKDLHIENSKHWWEEIKDLNKWRNILCVLIRRLSTIKEAIPFKLNCESMKSQSQNPIRYFCRNWQVISKVQMEMQRLG